MIEQTGLPYIENPQCLPFVSQYTDCTSDNRCSGCTRCECNRNGRWDCESSSQCLPGERENVDQEALDDALKVVLEAISRPITHSNSVEKPNFHGSHDDSISEQVVADEIDDIDSQIMSLLKRDKRSLDDKPNKRKRDSDSGTVKFHNAPDEINEDTLKNSNISGMLKTQTFDVKIKPKIPQKIDIPIKTNNSKTNSFHIAYKDPQDYKNNKIIKEAKTKKENDSLAGIENIFNNQAKKDVDLSKIVAKEMKNITEVIGDPYSTPISNLTFTPENETLAAVAYIAGNLLNKLWYIENEMTDNVKELSLADKMAELDEFFKEPLTINQKNVIKNALGKISEAVGRQGNIKNAKICKMIENEESKVERRANNDEAINNVQDVLNLIQKYETLKQNIDDIKRPENNNSQTNNTKIDRSSFLNVIDKVTNLLVPDNKAKNKKEKDSDKLIIKKVKSLFGIKIDESQLTIKDKILFNYLTEMEKGTKCTKKEPSYEPSMKRIEGDILLNLSEFFKIKSLTDLMNTDDSKLSHPLLLPQRRELAQVTTEKVNVAITTELPNDQLSKTKQKIKDHLKVLVDDLMELQKDSGNKTNYTIDNVLPCLKKFKLEKSNEQNVNTNDSIKELFEALKNNNNTQMTRKFSGGDTPKSADVWERAITTIVKNIKNARRSNNVPQYNFEEVDYLVQETNFTSSKQYKNQALNTKVLVFEKLVLLKALQKENKEILDILVRLKALANQNGIPKTKFKSINCFVNNTLSSIELSKNVINALLNKSDKKKTGKISNLPTLQTKIANSHKTRAELKDMLIVNLMKSKLNSFLKKEIRDGLKDSSNYIAAKKIMANLNKGKVDIAKIQFKKFIVNVKDNVSIDATDDLSTETLPHFEPTEEYLATSTTANIDDIYRRINSLLGVSS